MSEKSINIPVLIFTVVYLGLCFALGELVYLYPAIIIVLTLINFQYGLEFSFYTLGINYALFQEEFLFGIFHPNSFVTVGQILFVIVAAARLLDYKPANFISRFMKLKIDLKTIFLFAFAIWAFISLAYSMDKINGIKLLANFMLYPLVLFLFTNTKDVNQDKIYKLVLISALISFFLIYPVQALFFKDTLFFPDADRGPRFSGGRVYPVVLSFYMALVFFSALHMFDTKKKWYYLLFPLVAVIVSYFTYTRTSFIGLIGAFAVYFGIRHTDKVKYVIPLGFLGAIILFVTGILQKIFQFAIDFMFKNYARYHQTDFNYFTGGRMYFWSHSLSYFLKSPLIGVGLGSSIVIMDLFRVPTPHNDYVRIIVETGLIGFVLFCTYLALQGIHLLKKLKKYTLTFCLYLFFLLILFTDSTIDYNLYFTYPMFALLGIANQRSLRHFDYVPDYKDQKDQKEHAKKQEEDKEKHEKKEHKNEEHNKQHHEPPSRKQDKEEFHDKKHDIPVPVPRHSKFREKK